MAKSKPTKIEYYEMPPDLDIHQSIAQAIKLSRKHKTIVVFTFNKIEMRIHIPHKAKTKEDIKYYQTTYLNEYNSH